MSPAPLVEEVALHPTPQLICPPLAPTHNPQRFSLLL